MKMLKKLMAVALAGVMALVVLTGCASNAVNTKEILASMKDGMGSEYTLEDAGEADAAKLAAVLKEFKGKEAYKDTKVEDLLDEDEVITQLKKELVAAGNKDLIKVSVAKVESYKSKFYADYQYNMIASELQYSGTPIAYATAEPGKTEKVSLKVDQIGEDTYVFAVIHTAPKA